MAVVLIAAVTWGMCAHFEFAERVARWAKPLERYQLDELPTVLLITAVALVWFSWRRHRETQLELVQRLRAEATLNAALGDNRRLAQHYLDAQEDERRLLARELHDELGQYLNAIKLDAVALDGAPLPVLLRQRVQGIIDNVDHVARTVRTLIRQCRPVALDELGLSAALEHSIALWRRHQPQTQVECHVEDAGDGYGEAINLTVFRVVQEALTNISRHARARLVSITLHTHPPAGTLPACLHLEVRDDGVGASRAEPAGGLGLIGMRERVKMLGGDIEIDTAPRQGFRLHVRLPLGHGPAP